MFKVLMYDGGVYRSDELYEAIEDVGGVVLQKTQSAQMLTVVMSVPEEDRETVEAVCKDIGGEVKDVPLAGTEIAVVGMTLGRHHMPHPICDMAEIMRRNGAVTVVMGLARGRGKKTSQISAVEEGIIDEYDGAIMMMGNFKDCVETKAELLMPEIHVPLLLVCGPQPENVDEYCDAVVSGVGRRASRMRNEEDRAKLDEVVDAMDRLIEARKRSIEEDPLFVSPSEVKTVLENYGPLDMCLRPAPIVLHLDGLRLKIPYRENREALEDMVVYGRRLGEISEMMPSRIDDSSTIVRIKTRSQVEYEDRKRAGNAA